MNSVKSGLCNITISANLCRYAYSSNFDCLNKKNDILGKACLYPTF